MIMKPMRSLNTPSTSRARLVIGLGVLFMVLDAGFKIDRAPVQED
jgi:hypothetical protein